MTRPRKRQEPAPGRGTTLDPNQANREPARDRGPGQVHDDRPGQDPRKDDADA